MKTTSPISRRAQPIDILSNSQIHISIGRNKNHVPPNKCTKTRKQEESKFRLEDLTNNKFFKCKRGGLSVAAIASLQEESEEHVQHRTGEIVLGEWLRRHSPFGTAPAFPWLISIPNSMAEVETRDWPKESGVKSVLLRVLF